jgi:hypothetical protein
MTATESKSMISFCDFFNKNVVIAFNQASDVAFYLEKITE